MTRFGLDHVTVAYGRWAALHDVSFLVAPGEVVAVVGGDGAGKTTVGRVLAGLAKPASGTVVVPRGGSVGYQPAGSGVWPDLTVAENLDFVASAFGMDGSRASSRVSELIAAIGLDGAAGRLGGRLSGGMRQKLGVAMALLPEPQLLVLDEPTTGVDPVSRFDLWRLVSRAAASGAAVVMTTTYLDEAERASQILALDRGEMLARGDLDSIVASLPGTVFAAGEPGDAAIRWRRGAGWRVWDDGAPAPGATPVEPDLSDVLTALALTGRTLVAS